MKAGRYRFSESFERQLTNLLSGRRGDGSEYGQNVYAAKAMNVKPPSEKQLKFLRSLGYEGDAPESMAVCSAKIDELLRFKK
jgi:hypothetical protein